MAARDRVYEYVKEHQPITRRAVLRHFYPSIDKTTVYTSIRLLVQMDKLIDRDGQLITMEYTPPVKKDYWATHPVLQELKQAPTQLALLYANKDERLLELARTLLESPRINQLIVDLQILTQVGAMDYKYKEGMPELNPHPEIILVEDLLEREIEYLKNLS